MSSAEKTQEARENSAIDRANNALRAFNSFAEAAQIETDGSLELYLGSYETIGYLAIKALSEEFHTQDIRIGSKLETSGYCDTCSNTSAETLVYLRYWS